VLWDAASDCVGVVVAGVLVLGAALAPDMPAAAPALANAPATIVAPSIFDSFMDGDLQVD